MLGTSVDLLRFGYVPIPESLTAAAPGDTYNTSPARALSMRHSRESAYLRKLRKMLRASAPEDQDWASIGLDIMQAVEAMFNEDGSTATEDEAYARLHGAVRTYATATFNLEELFSFVGGVKKRWVARHDSKTRPSHLKADGQTVELWEPFRVGGFSLQFPGDPTAPFKETRGCRCVLVAVPPPRRRPRR